MNQINKKNVDNVSKNNSKDLKSIMLFELSVGGHYPEYIAHLIKYWRNIAIDKKLYLVLSPLFFKQHPDVVNLADRYNLKNVFYISISSEEFAHLKPFNININRNIRAWQEFQLIRKYAIKLKSDCIFLPYFDTRQIPIILSKQLPCSYSGIYFRPSFHYQSFPNHNLSLKGSLQYWREKIILNLVLRNSRLKTLFCLDPFAIEHIKKINQEKQVIYLPDPVENNTSSSSNLKQLKSSLGIDSSRQVHLLFGQLSDRKGVKKILQSIPLLPAELCQRLCILLIGPMTEQYSQEVQDIVSQLTATLPVQIIIKNQYIPAEDIQHYYKLADIILALYQRHVGMSGILCRAALAQKPVLASNYGLMGQITHRSKLGLTVDSSKVTEIAKGFTKYLTEPTEKYCDRVLMKQFAEQNTPEKFANTIFKHIFE